MGTKLNKKVLGLGVALFGMVFGASSVFAAPVLYIIDLNTGTSLTITDEVAGDQALGTSGFVLYTTVAGELDTVPFVSGDSVWTITTSSGVTKPADGSPTDANIHLNTLTVSSSGGGDLLVMFSDTDFVSTGGNMWFDVGIGGVVDPGGTMDIMSCAIGSDANLNTLGDDLLCTGGDIISSGSYGGAFALTTGGGVNSSGYGGDFSLGTAVLIHHTSGGTSSVDIDVQVPEPGILGLFGFGLLGMGLAARRRRIV